MRPLFLVSVEVMGRPVPDLYAESAESAEGLVQSVGGRVVSIEPTARPPAPRCLCCRASLSIDWEREAGMCIPCHRRGLQYEANWEFKRRVHRHQRSWLEHVSRLAEEKAA